MRTIEGEIEMKKLKWWMMVILPVFILAVMMEVVAQETQEPKELTQARAAYLQKLEALKKSPGMAKNAEAIDSEIDRVKAGIPDVEEAAAPDKPGAKPVAKGQKLAEFPKDITAEEWGRLPGKVVKVNIEDRVNGREPVFSVKDKEAFFAVPHPTDRWNLSKKASCTWEGLMVSTKYGYSIKTGELILMVRKTDADASKVCMSSLKMNNAIIGPMQVFMGVGTTTEEYPKVYFSGTIRVKLVPAEQ
jgi:hypothetical protein